ncbi:MAG TPA: AMP-binding protein [bacterium]|nr:AMP-binding protein [bacterium]
MNVAELLWIPAGMMPDRTIVRFDGEQVTYAELQDRVGRTAGALRALGVQAGDRVAVLDTNTPAVIEVAYAAASLGAVFVPLNYRARSGELLHMVDAAAPRVLLVGARYLDLAGEVGRACAAPPRFVTLEHPVPGLAHLADATAEADAVPPVEVADDDLAVLMFTSGTTANAKATMLAHADLVNYVFGTTDAADESENEAVLIAAPIYHIAGLTAVHTAMFAGRRIVLMRQFDAGEWLRLAAEQCVTHAFLVPTMLKRVLDHPAFASTDLSGLRVLSYGAAPMPLNVIRRAIASFPPSVQFVNAFGQTETTGTVTMLSPLDHRLDGAPGEVETNLRRLSSVGRPLPDVTIRVIDPQGNPLGPGRVGEVTVQTARAMRGYYGQAAATRAALQDGWVRTGDLGWLDEDGYLYLAGRKSDLIIRGGENIAPEEVEVVLKSHPAVDEVAVFGVADEEWGERVAAAVVRQPGAEITAEDLIEFCRQRLGSFKKPEFVLFTDVLPRSALGKLLRKDLRVLYEAEQAAPPRKP